MSLVQERASGGTGACSTRTYAFDKNSNRTAKVAYPADSSGNCVGSGGTGTTVSSSYDTADRIQTASTEYDSFGRTISAPSSSVTGGADVLVGYFANDLVACQGQGGTASTCATKGAAVGSAKQTWTLDQGQQRLRAWTVTTNNAVTASRTNHYDDAGGDSPDWVAETSDGTSWTVNVSDPLGSLAATVDQAGTGTFQYANIHGDVHGTSAANAGAPTIGLLYDEYGNPPSGATSPRYGWLGGKQRSREDLGGLVLMGVRLYNAISGRFLSVDPIVGGNPNSYVYPPDPVNMLDLDGRQSKGEEGGGGTPPAAGGGRGGRGGRSSRGVGGGSYYGPGYSGSNYADDRGGRYRNLEPRRPGSWKNETRQIDKRKGAPEPYRRHDDYKRHPSKQGKKSRFAYVIFSIWRVIHNLPF